MLLVNAHYTVSNAEPLQNWQLHPILILTCAVNASMPNFSLSGVLLPILVKKRHKMQFLIFFQSSEGSCTPFTSGPNFALEWTHGVLYNAKFHSYW